METKVRQKKCDHFLLCHMDIMIDIEYVFYKCIKCVYIISFYTFSTFKTIHNDHVI